MSKIGQKIILFLADYPEREFYGQEIADKIRCSKASASLILRILTKNKLVSVVSRGHMKFYRINAESIEVKRLKIESILKKINPIVLKLQKISQKIILFGSGSRGEQTADSDIDFFVVTREKEDVRKIIEKARYRLPMKVILETPNEWSEMEEREPEFFQEVKNGITLYSYVSRI